MRRVLALAVLATVAWSASASASPAKPPCGLSGSFRIYSTSFVYDAGGTGTPATGFQTITLSGSTWQFGQSKGTFTTGPITGADWKKWRAKPYGPTQKIVLSGWNHGTADGPLETEPHAVDFFWVIYHVVSPTPGLVELKFGHSIVPKSCP